MHENEPVVRKLRIPVRYEDHWPIPFQQVVFAASRRAHNLKVFKWVLNETQANVVLFWPTGYVDRSLMLAAEQIPGLTVAYYIAGVSPTQPSLLAEYWSHPGRSRRARLVKSLLRPLLANDKQQAVHLATQHVMCVSEYERQRVIREGVASENAVVIHNGVDPNQFRFLGLPSTRRQPGASFKVLYSGRIVSDKGAHTAIEALRILRQSNPETMIHLTLLGTGPRSYVQELDQRISAYGLGQFVERRAWIQRDQVPASMAGFDVLILPTIHPEPLARTIQEAMAMGLVVVATPTGGTPEIVHDGTTGLTFGPDNPWELATCLLRLYLDLTLSDRLADQAYRLVKAKFTIQGMAKLVEQQLSTWMQRDV